MKKHYLILLTVLFMALNYTVAQKRTIGEMYLIKAEAYAREDQLEKATNELNKVLTKIRHKTFILPIRAR